MLKQGLPYIIALVVLGLLFSLLGYPLLKKNNEAKNILAEKENTLKKIYASGSLPSNELISAMEKDNMVLADKYKKVREKFPAAKEFSIPEGVNLPLFFLEELKNLKERIRTKAKEKKVAIPAENLGLPTTLPSDQEAPQLIKNLYLTEIIVNLLFETGINSIDNIELGEITKTDIYEDIPLTLSVKCDMLSLTKLLFTLENTEQGFFIIKDFSLRPETIQESSKLDSKSSITAEPPKEKMIQVDLMLSLIRWK